MEVLQIADDVVPPWAVRQFLIGIAKVLPTYKLVPQKDLADMAFRDPKKKPLVCFGFLILIYVKTFFLLLY